MLIAILVPVAFYALICLLLFLRQNSLIYFPQPRAQLPGIDTWSFESGGERIVVSSRPASGADALIYFGGNAEDVAFSAAELATAFPSHAIHAMHYRSYGGSTGKPSERALVEDALALFDSLHARHERIAVIGRSLGSGVAVRLAVERPVWRLVLVTPFDSLVAIARTQFGWLPLRWLMRSRFESLKHAPQVKAPTLLVIAAGDEIVPRASSEALVAAFRPGVARSIVLEGDHNGLAGGYLEALQAGLSSPP